MLLGKAAINQRAEIVAVLDFEGVSSGVPGPAAQTGESGLSPIPSAVIDYQRHRVPSQSPPFDPKMSE